MKQIKRTYWLLGFGCGIVLSGIIGAITALGIQDDGKKISNVLQQQVEQTYKKQDQNTQDNETEDEYKTQKYEEKHEVNESVSLPTNIPDVEVKEIETIEVYIPSKATAREIATILHEHGVVDDATSFLEFVREQKKTTKLKDGNLTFVKNESYEEVLNTLTGK